METYFSIAMDHFKSARRQVELCQEMAAFFGGGWQYRKRRNINAVVGGLSWWLRTSCLKVWI